MERIKKSFRTTTIIMGIMIGILTIMVIVRNLIMADLSKYSGWDIYQLSIVILVLGSTSGFLLISSFKN